MCFCYRRRRLRSQIIKIAAVAVVVAVAVVAAAVVVREKGSYSCSHWLSIQRYQTLQVWGQRTRRFVPVCVFPKPKIPPPIVFGCCCCCGCCWVFVFDPNSLPPGGLSVVFPNRPVVVLVLTEVFPPQTMQWDYSALSPQNYPCGIRIRLLFQKSRYCHWGWRL